MDNQAGSSAAAAPPGLLQRATDAANFIRKRLPDALQKPKVAIVCGTGLGGLVDAVEAEPKVELGYDEVPGFPGVTGTSALSVVKRAQLWAFFLFAVVHVDSKIAWCWLPASPLTTLRGANPA